MALGPTRFARKKRVARDNAVEGRGGGQFSGVHGRGTVDDVGDAAPGFYNLLYGVIVEIAGDVKVEVFLVRFDG